MLLESRTISRKTPADGKLEISPATAHALARVPGELRVTVGQATGVASVTSMSCSCSKGTGGHIHHFLESDLFRTLRPDARVGLELDDRLGELHLREQR